MRIGLHDEGLVLLTPEIPGEPSEAVRRASGGPFFSVLPEKNGEKRGAWLRLVHSAGAAQAGTYYLVSANTHSHPTRVLVRAACYGTAQFVSRCV